MEQNVELSVASVLAFRQIEVAGYPDQTSCAGPNKGRLALHVPRGRIKHVRVDYRLDKEKAT